MIRPVAVVIYQSDYFVTTIEAELLTCPPRPSLTVTVITTFRLVFGTGGVNLAVFPVPVIVPAVAVHVKVNGSLSGSDAATVRELVCVELIVVGTATSLLVMTGG